MHKELNTMTVNHGWKLGELTCPFCHGVKEDWKHIIHCTKHVRKELKAKCVSDFELSLEQYETYPPLSEFLISFVTSSDYSPEEPVIRSPDIVLCFIKHTQIKNL